MQKVKTITEIKAAVIELLSSVCVQAGYKTELNSLRIHDGLSHLPAEGLNDADFPRVVVIARAGEDELLPGAGLHSVYEIDLVFQAREIQGADVLMAQLEGALDDFSRLFYQVNPTLQGTVNSVVMTRYEFDGGEAYPNGRLYVGLTVDTNRNTDNTEF